MVLVENKVGVVLLTALEAACKADDGCYTLWLKPSSLALTWQQGATYLLVQFSCSQDYARTETYRNLWGSLR